MLSSAVQVIILCWLGYSILVYFHKASVPTSCELFKQSASHLVYSTLLMYTACFVSLPTHCSKINCVRHIALAMPSGLLICLSADPRVQDLHPQGATPAFAAPEVLRFLQKQHEGAELNQWGKVPVNGPSSDWWSVGVVLFFLLAFQ